MSGLSLGELAEQFGLELRGDADYLVTGVCTLLPGKSNNISFLVGASYRKQLSESQAGAVILAESDAEQWPGNALISSNPHADFARVGQLFDPAQRKEAAGIHAAAHIAATASVPASTYVGPGVVIGERAVIGEGCQIGPGCVIGADVTLGAESRLVANVTLYDRVHIGARAHFQPGVVVGGRGFGLASTESGWLEVPQLGSVRIGDDVEIGANSCIDRGAIDDTLIANGVKIDNLVQIGHNTIIGEHTAIAGCAGISGSCTIGARCQIGGAVGIVGHITIADGVVVAGKSLVTNSIKEPGLYSSSLPSQPAAIWRRQLARLRKLDDLFGRVKALEKKS